MSDLDYAALFQAIPGPHLILLPDAPTYTIAAVNDAYTVATMSQRADLIGRGLFETFPNDDDATRAVIVNLRASLDTVVRSRKSHDMELLKCAIRRAPQGGGGFEDRFWETSNTPVLDGEGNIQFIIHNIVDVTDKFRIDSALRQSEHFNRCIVDSSPDCVKVLDVEGRLLSMNEEGRQQLEIDDLSLYLNLFWADLWPVRERECARAAIAQARAGKTAKFEGFCATMKGTMKWWENVITPIQDDADTPRRLLCISRDITARKRLETAAHEAQESAEAANLAKSEFLANISHEIRTPLNAIVGLSMILAKSEGLAPRQRDYVQTLQVSANSLLGLINDLLDISKIESRSIELEHIPFDLARLLNEIVSMMSVPATEKNLDIRIERPPVSGQVLMGDPMRLQQIILNLCTNAIRFTEVGGVYLGVNSHPCGIDGCRMFSISVRDTGTGIPADKQHLIFEKFVQADSSISRKFGGTGLGLAITRELTEAMGGTITLQSFPGKGTIFTVMLPLMIGGSLAATELPAYVDAVAYPLEADFRTIVTAKASPAMDQRVLLIEDHEGNVLVASTFIEDFGCSYDLATNGFDAIEKARAGSYVAILMDIQIPGLNGFEVTRAIRAYERGNNKPRVPIIAMTAHALTSFRDRCLASDMDDYLSKPFNARELESKLEKYVDFAYCAPGTNSTPGTNASGTVMLSERR